MTLHWWSHYFWRTILIVSLAVNLTIGIPNSINSITFEKDPLSESQEDIEKTHLDVSFAVVDDFQDGDNQKLTKTLMEKSREENFTSEVIKSTEENAVFEQTTTSPHLNESDSADFNLFERENTTLLNQTSEENITLLEKQETKFLGRKSKILTQFPEKFILRSTPVAGRVQSNTSTFDENENSRSFSSGTNYALLSITLVVATIMILLIIVAGIVYRFRLKYQNKPQNLSEVDSSYIDNTSLREISDEFSLSLDNDSFLNSLEAMAISSYFSDLKHTKL